MEVLSWSSALEKEALHFLNRRYECSMFLLDNFGICGPFLSEHPNSGNFKVLQDEGGVAGVFCLSRRGNILVQVSEEKISLDVIQTICESCLAENIIVKGVLGPWEVSFKIWEELKLRRVVVHTSFSSKEILYRLDEVADDAARKVEFGQVRYLATTDFDQWFVARNSYLGELGLRQDLSKDQMRISFDDLVGKKRIWGLFENGILVAMAGLNSKVKDIGQVGGVFTLAERRKKGLAKVVMMALRHDCYFEQGISKMILFTGETNLPAQALYESLGYQKIGYYGMIFG